MARAKRFDRDRAEARRRYRATLVGADAPTTGNGEDEPTLGEAAPATPTAPGASPRRTADRPAARSATPTAPRLKIAQAFRVAFRQANLREDLPQVPRLIVHRAVWMPLLAAVASLAVFVATGPKNNLTYFAFQTFVLPPSMATLFIAGFFVPTAAYLMGGIVGTATAVLYCVFVALASQGLVPDVAADSVEISQQIGFAFSIGPVSGVVLGAAAAWYRRFLYLSSPARPGAAGRPGASGNRRPRGASGRTGTRGR